MGKRLAPSPSIIVASMLLLLSSTDCRAFRIASFPTVRTTSTRPRAPLVVALPHGLATNPMRFPQRGEEAALALAAVRRGRSGGEAEERKRSIASEIKRRALDVITFGFGPGRRKKVASFLLSLSIFLLPFSVMLGTASAVHSGGRMGGSFGGSRSRPSSSRSYSTPGGTRRSGSGMGGHSGRSGGYSSGCGGYSNGGYGRGYSRGYYPRTNLIMRMGYRPFSPYYSQPSASGVAVARPNPLTKIFYLAGIFYVASYVLSNIDIDGDVAHLFGNANGRAPRSALGPGVSVAEISVALRVPDRDDPDSILSALHRLSATSRTDSRVGVQNLTSQVAIELLRRKSSIVAASTRASHFRDEGKAEREYNTVTIGQRGKFTRETLSKYGGVDYSDPRIEAAETEYDPKATIAVATIVLMIDGDSTSKQLSSNINSVRDAEAALSCIAADAKMENCLRGAEILWTPEERDETLTMKEVLADYPTLRMV